jgi:hypothetical protein
MKSAPGASGINVRGAVYDLPPTGSMIGSASAAGSRKGYYWNHEVTPREVNFRHLFVLPYSFPHGPPLPGTVFRRV